MRHAKARSSVPPGLPWARRVHRVASSNRAEQTPPRDHGTGGCPQGPLLQLGSRTRSITAAQLARSITAVHFTPQLVSAIALIQQFV